MRLAIMLIKRHLGTHILAHNLCVAVTQLARGANALVEAKIVVPAAPEDLRRRPAAAANVGRRDGVLAHVALVPDGGFTVLLVGAAYDGDGLVEDVDAHCAGA